MFVVFAVPARAQLTAPGADSLLAAGRLAQAERMYYSASTANPRDAVARASLGRFLAARGALRIGAVLLEEARQFGGDTARIARDLAPVYAALGDYRALASLRRSPLTPAERQRAVWLGANQQSLEFGDSAASLPYRPSTNGEGLGVVSLAIGNRRVEATIVPDESGLTLRGAAARSRSGLRTFGTDATGAIAVAPAVRVGNVVLGNEPVRAVSGTGTDTMSTIGLDVLRRLAPTFDPAARTIALRRSGQVPTTERGNRLPYLFDAQGFRILVDGKWRSIAGGENELPLAARRWTFDARRGDVILQ